MIVKLVGHAYKKGTSKASGKPYEMTLLYVSYPDPYVTGERTSEIVVAPDMVAELRLTPGQQYNIDIGLNGRVCGVSVALPPQSGIFGDRGKGGK